MQKAGELVERAQQTSQEQRDALDEFKDTLVKKEVLAHKDKVHWVGSPYSRHLLWGIEATHGTLYLLLTSAHTLQDVKLRNAFCLCHVLRMHAPDTPYSNRVLEVSRPLALSSAMS